MSARRIFGLFIFLTAALFAAGFLVEPLPARAAEAQAATENAPPEAADLLFERPQLAATRPGDVLFYVYARKVTDAELGPSFEDRIRLIIEPGAGSSDARDVRVDFFAAERHRAAGPFEGATTNPVLMLFLENHLVELSGRLKGNPRYFKNAIRSALRDRARVEPADIVVDGRTLKGWRVTVKPFEGDANAARMRGLETLTYTFDVAPGVPGEVVRMEIAAEAPGGRLWEETIAYDPKGS
ncbi:hypothetical protein K9U40_17920 [Xanthobacter autotrophicus]|uniref:hypothetical protein n=1 Tax=Xanthobacter TaxID=279 RepID=UPI0024AAF0F7|nr:hypothetical protein [Xanthobacter autotrophicus]MDI4666185.1 hypothetical protein [Xanthobacter autotrophicus]